MKRWHTKAKKYLSAAEANRGEDTTIPTPSEPAADMFVLGFPSRNHKLGFERLEDDPERSRAVDEILAKRKNK